MSVTSVELLVVQDGTIVKEATGGRFPAGEGLAVAVAATVAARVAVGAATVAARVAVGAAVAPPASSSSPHAARNAAPSTTTAIVHAVQRTLRNLHWAPVCGSQPAADS